MQPSYMTERKMLGTTCRPGHLAQVGVLAGDAEDVAQLLLVGVVHFVEALELGRVTGLDAQLLLGQRTLPL